MKKTILFLIVILVPVTGHSQNAETAKYSAEAEKTAKDLATKIQAEIKILGNHPWAGEYYLGDGMGVNVHFSISPKTGYVFEWHGCMGLYDRNYGAVTAKNGKLQLSFTFENKREEVQGIDEEFIPVAWGKRSYLIPSKDVVGFCNEVNDGSEPRDGLHGKYLLRVGDEKKAVSGFPTVPQEFKSYLLAKPIETEITAVGKSATRSFGSDLYDIKTAVTLKDGKKAGLLTGMKLYVTEDGFYTDSVTVRKVEEDRSEGIMSQMGEKDQRPKVGWKLSTLAPWDKK